MSGTTHHPRRSPGGDARMEHLPVKLQTLILLLIISQALDVITTHWGIQLGLTEGNELLADIAGEPLHLIEFKVIFFFPAIILPVVLLHLAFIISAGTVGAKGDGTGGERVRSAGHLSLLLKAVLLFLLVWSWAVIVNNLIGIVHVTILH